MFTRVAQNAYISKAQRFLKTKALKNSCNLSNTNFQSGKLPDLLFLEARTSLQSYLQWSENSFFGLFLDIKPAQCWAQAW